MSKLVGKIVLFLFSLLIIWFFSPTIEVWVEADFDAQVFEQTGFPTKEIKMKHGTVDEKTFRITIDFEL